MPQETAQPMYVRIAKLLSDQIGDGTYPAGSQLPTEERLCEHFGVSRHTVREALRMLRQANLIESRKKAGTIVLPQEVLPNFVHVMSIEDLIAFSAWWRFEIERIEERPLEEPLKRWARETGRTAWLTFAGTARAKGLECWAEYFVHPRFAAIRTQLKNHKGRILRLIEDRFRVQIASMLQDISAALISPELAKKLQVSKGTAAVIVRRMYRTSTGLIAAITTETYPSHKFRFTTELHRHPAHAVNKLGSKT